ncbi:MAG TPA: aminopeptidase [Burkholderiaceae bacterium]|nr:aminopeptidase [Burkholderiaceae bacterium]
MRRIAVIALLLSAVLGCSTLNYYGQAIGGHFSILGRTRPIDDIIADPSTAPTLKAKLQRVATIRAFASSELGLPENDSYRYYADLERPFAVWNVFAAPELSLTPREWCFPVAGCVSYRGYFARTAAEAEAQRWRDQGDDVYVGGVIAYSTLGWFEDPLLNTMLDRPEPELAGLMFHELAHQKIYLRDDTAFNESFAMTVEREGVRRWLASQNAQAEYAAFLERAQRYEAFTTLVMRYRDRLGELYRSAVTDNDKRTGKKDEFDALRRDYAELKQRWGGYSGYDKWMENLNNARLLSVGLYHQHIPAFEALLARHNGNLPDFFRAANALAREPKDVRERMLAELIAETISAARGVGAQR